MDRQTLLKLWNEANTDGLWHVAWSKAVGGLTPAQAAWKPHPDRHSIWQNVNHLVFWREVTLAKSRGQPAPSDAETGRRNFEEPSDNGENAWRAAVARLADSHRSIGAAIADPAVPLDRFLYHLPHDSYHIGQIMLLRAMQGLPPLD